MYDMLTLAELYQLHRDLARQHHEVHAKLIDTNDPDRRPLISPLSAEWDVLAAKEAEIGETMHAVYAEAARREGLRSLDA